MALNSSPPPRAYESSRRTTGPARSAKYRYTVLDRNSRKCPRCPGNGRKQRYPVSNRKGAKSVTDPLHRVGEGSYLLIESSATCLMGWGGGNDQRIPRTTRTCKRKTRQLWGLFTRRFRGTRSHTKSVLNMNTFEWNHTASIMFDAFCGKNITIDFWEKD